MRTEDFLNWFETEDSREWEAFVSRNSGSIYHSWNWRNVLESSGIKTLYSVCRDESGNVRAVCPFAYRKVSRGVRILDSLPVGHMSGPVFEIGQANIIAMVQSLMKWVRSTALKNRIDSIIIKMHQQSVAQSFIDSGFRCSAHYGLFILDLRKKSMVDIWNNEFNKHDRQAVKYYEQAGASFSFVQSENDYSNFLTLYEESMDRKHYRPMIRNLASVIRSHFGERFKIAKLNLNNAMIAGQSLICDPQNSIIHFAPGAYSRTKNIHSPTIYINWKIIEWANETGFRFVNFGPSLPHTSNPVYKSKRKFGGEFVQGYRFELRIRSSSRTAIRILNNGLHRMRRAINLDKAE